MTYQCLGSNALWVVMFLLVGYGLSRVLLELSRLRRRRGLYDQLMKEWNEGGAETEGEAETEGGAEIEGGAENRGEAPPPVPQLDFKELTTRVRRVAGGA